MAIAPDRMPTVLLRDVKAEGLRAHLRTKPAAIPAGCSDALFMMMCDH